MKQTVLVIENDTKAASLIAKSLEAEGRLVFTASSGDASIAMARKVSPALIFLSLATPGTNGLEICKALHAVEAIKDAPIVLLTVRESKYEPRYKNLYNIVAFLKKPFTPEDVLSVATPNLQAETSPAEETPEEEQDVSMEEGMFDLARPVETAWKEEKEPAGEKEPLPFFMSEEPEMPEMKEMKETDFGPKGPAVPVVGARSPSQGAVPPISQGAVPPMPGKDFPEEPKMKIEPPANEFKIPDDIFNEPQKKPDPLPEMKGASQKKRFKPQAKERRWVIPAIAVSAAIVLAALAYIYFSRPEGAPPRKLAETTIAQHMPSKPLRKPQGSAGEITAPPSAAEAAIPVPKPVPVTKPEVKAPVAAKGPAYYVQFGAFSVEKNAEALAGDLKAKGQDASIMKAVAGGKDIYRVLSPSQASRNAALDLAHSLKAKGIEASVYQTAKAEPKPVVRAEPPAKPEAKPSARPGPAKGKYYVQFGAFSVEKNAEALAGDLKAKGQDASILKSASGGKDIYRVLSPSQASRNAALDLAHSLKAKGIETTVYQTR